ncbi:hypothetical protein F5Y07DRAFT_369051 [Xylaria sp. FL0933]|nr:hypothetical protein F5Y07DRAFT_369051 [Xylaria sp. FL0933]
MNRVTPCLLLSACTPVRCLPCYLSFEFLASPRMADLTEPFYLLTPPYYISTKPLTALEVSHSAQKRRNAG